LQVLFIGVTHLADEMYSLWIKKVSKFAPSLET
jgi:hypothetical protein